MITERTRPIRSMADNPTIDEVITWVQEQARTRLSINLNEQQIDTWSRQAVTQLWNAKVRSYIPILALREVEERLRSVSSS